MKSLSRRLRLYIQHCPECQRNQITRHTTHGEYQPILSFPILFDTITIDFVVALPITANGYNAFMSVTDKFSKMVNAIPGKDTFSAGDWIKAFLK